MEPVSTIDPNNEDCNNGLHHTNGGHSTASKGSFDITSTFFFSFFSFKKGSEDESVQEASADCLQNIRKLALACEKFRYQHMKS